MARRCLSTFRALPNSAMAANNQNQNRRIPIMVVASAEDKLGYHCQGCRQLSTGPSLRGKQKDYYYEEKLPVYEYNKINTEKNRIYVFGAALHGGLGLETLVRPKEKGQKQYAFSWKPVRHRFAETHQVTDAVAGHGFTLIAIKPRVENGPIVFGCGANKTSQLGYQSARLNAPMQTLLAFVPLPILAKKSSRVLALGAGKGHSLISIEGEGLYTLGDNFNGQCGRVIVENEEYFGSQHVQRFSRFKEDDVVCISARFDSSVCVTKSGKVHTFGANENGQLGRGKFTPTPWEPSQAKGDLEQEIITKVVSSGSSTLAISDKGELFGWGCNEFGQVDPSKIGHTLYEPRHVKLPLLVGKLRDIAIGDFFSFILNEQGEVYVWGQGVCLGLGPSTNLVKYPTIIPPPLFGQNKFSPDVQVVSIASSYFFASAVNSVGDMYTWGKDVMGCLGLGKLKHQFFPLKVAMGAAVKKASLGIDHSILLAKGGL